MLGLRFIRRILSTLKCLDYLVLKAHKIYEVYCKGILSISTWGILEKQGEVLQNGKF